MTQAFIHQLRYVAEASSSAQLSGLSGRLLRPVRFAVLGRDGVGRGSVAAALAGRGFAVAPLGDLDGFDVAILVVAETVKAEDFAIARAAGRPVLTVLTKADLSGAGAGGPIAVARRRAAEYSRQTGAVAVPVVGLLAALEGAGNLEDDLVAALRLFVTDPPNLRSVDAFVGDPHPVSGDVRARLLARLDRFGIAHAVLALAEGGDPERLPTHLARIGNLDHVATALAEAAAAVRYGWVRSEINELHCLAAESDAELVSDLLVDDVTIMASMTAAVDVVEAAGLIVDRGDTVSAHLDRAVRWRRYGRGPVNALHRHCSADIVRGSLRLMAGAREST